jgi:UDP-N-acetyl-D-galactosamine dehydrogenase
MTSERLALVGLGYVGLPLAVALGRHYPVAGFDVDRRRIGELRSGIDCNGEVAAEALRGSPIAFSDDPSILRGATIVIVTAPTPVDADRRPDLSAVKAAAETIGRWIAPGTVVVFESTVYPGVTEDVAGSIVAATSGLVCGRDFFLGYSPERINVGDPEHGLSRLPKVVAGQTPEVARRLAAIYGKISSSVYVAKDIRTAEAAKVIENAQRDLNIAFVNEIAIVFDRMGLNTHDVLETAATKWNFHRYVPGLVGGHCIGVDPYYLAHAAEAVGIDPAVVLAGRRVNDGMGEWFAGRIWQELGNPPAARVLLLGLTFKENVRDLRNSRVADLEKGLRRRGAVVMVHDPLADADEAKSYYGIDLVPSLQGLPPADAVVVAVAHRAFRDMPEATVDSLIRPAGLIADIKGVWRDRRFTPGIRRWSL